jgi:hypothetical protein
MLVTKLKGDAMRIASAPLILLLVANVVAGQAFADDRIKPGLWEMTMKSDMMKSMPKIPPEQMEQMRKLGISLPDMRDGAMVTKVCITKEMAAQDHPPMMDSKDTGCQSKNYQRSGNSYSVDIVCDGRHMKGEGKAKGVFSGSDSFSSTYDFKGTAEGRPVTQHHETSGKWLAADCGDVKPMSAMLPKQ